MISIFCQNPKSQIPNTSNLGFWHPKSQMIQDLGNMYSLHSTYIIRIIINTFISFIFHYIKLCINIYLYLFVGWFYVNESSVTNSRIIRISSLLTQITQMIIVITRMLTIVTHLIIQVTQQIIQVTQQIIQITHLIVQVIQQTIQITQQTI